MSEERRALVYAAGREAGEQGRGEEACDQMRGTIYFDDWHDGYLDGKRDKPLVGHN